MLYVILNQHHEELIQEFRQEKPTVAFTCNRFRPDYEMRARPIEEYPEMRTGKSHYADDPKSRLCRTASTSSRINHIWRKRSCFSKTGTQYLLTQYLSEMTDEQH
jgi:urocanate hydratase